MMTETLFGSAQVNRYATLNVASANCPIPQSQGTITMQNAFPAILAFLQLIGWIGFLRGMYILKGAAEGNQQASAFAAFSHIIGGAIAVNFAAFARALDQSAGLNCIT